MSDPNFPPNIPPVVPPALPASGFNPIVSEVYFRVGGQMPRSDTGAIGGNGTTGTVTYYVNEALGVIAGSATFLWDVSAVSLTIPGAPSAPTFDLSTLANPIDLGGHIEISNDNGIPITRVDDERILDGRRNQYISFNPIVFNQWYIVGTSPGILHFKPQLTAATTVQISYKALPPILTDSVTSTLRWTNPWMDALLCDFAEMEISRILGFGGADTLQARCIQKLKDARSMFTMQRKETGPPDEVEAGAREAKGE